MKKSRIRKLNEKISAIKDELFEIAEEAQAIADERSVEWNESESGEEYNDNIQRLDCAINALEDSCGELEEISPIET